MPDLAIHCAAGLACLSNVQPTGGSGQCGQSANPAVAKVRELTPGNTHLHNWLDMARERIAFQGLPARICWRVFVAVSIRMSIWPPAKSCIAGPEPR